MIGIDFIEFLLLLIIGIVVAAILRQLGLIPSGQETDLIFYSIIGWLGGWLGSPVFGFWFEVLSYESVYILPAIFGSLAAITIVSKFLISIQSSTT